MQIYSALYRDGAHLERFGNLNVVEDPSELKEPGILILHGGEDISPSIYGHGLSSLTRASNKPSFRDRAEVALANRAIGLGIPIFGICRGAQLACALA